MELVKMKHLRCRFVGFTLIELIIAVALVGLLLTIAIPGYQTLRQEQMVKAATQAIYTDMMLLKSEAIKRNTSITLKIFNAGQADWCYRIAIDSTCASCADSCSAVDGRKGVDASEFGGVMVDTTNNYQTGATASIPFSPRSSNFMAGHIKVSNATGSHRVTLANNGRVSTCVEGDGSCS